MKRQMNDMKIVFIIGPYRASSEWELEEHIHNAELVAIKWWQKGWAVICPHKNSAHFGGLCPDEVWLEGDKEILKRCDAVCLVGGWSKSEGSLSEVALAKERGISIYFDDEAERGI